MEAKPMNLELERLTETQRRQLYAELAYEFGRQAKAVENLTGDETMVWDAINDTVRTHRPFSDVMAKTKGYSRDRFADDVDFLAAWLDRGCSRPVNRTQRAALFGMAIGCLSRYLDRASVPIVHRNLLLNLDKVGTAVNRAFPGYQSAGVLDRLAMMSA
jgi:hypothetical protein